MLFTTKKELLQRTRKWKNLHAYGCICLLNTKFPTHARTHAHTHAYICNTYVYIFMLYIFWTYSESVWVWEIFIRDTYPHTTYSSKVIGLHWKHYLKSIEIWIYSNRTASVTFTMLVLSFIYTFHWTTAFLLRDIISNVYIMPYGETRLGFVISEPAWQVWIFYKCTKKSTKHVNVTVGSEV